MSILGLDINHISTLISPIDSKTSSIEFTSCVVLNDRSTVEFDYKTLSEEEALYLIPFDQLAYGRLLNRTEQMKNLHTMIWEL